MIQVSWTRKREREIEMDADWMDGWVRDGLLKNTESERKSIEIKKCYLSRCLKIYQIWTKKEDWGKEIETKKERQVKKDE